MWINKRNRRNAGDTIVEVMVVLAVLGLAIGISYSTASRSLKNTRAAQDNAEATQLLQAQLETLRYMAPTLAASPGYTGLNSGGPFCIDTAAAQVTPDSSAIKHTTGCKGLGNNGQYEVQITYSATDNSFELKALWDDVITSTKKDTVTFNYRPYN